MANNNKKNGGSHSSNSKVKQNSSRVGSRHAGAQKPRDNTSPGKPGIMDPVAAALTNNDVSWYAQNPELLLDAASISYNTALGTKTNIMSKASTTQDRVESIYTTFPGIMVLKNVPGVGWSEDNNSAVNVAARNLYAWVRHVNSGSKVGDPADLMLYFLAMDSLYSYVAWCRRIYGELMLVSQYNRYLPRAQVESEGLSYDDMINHIVDLRYFINQFTLKLGVYVIPDGIHFLTRHMWMYTNVYMDAPNMKAQMYKYVPMGFWKYNETDGPGRLDWVSTKEGMTFAELVELGESLFNAIGSSEDIGVMSGDILKAFGDNIFRMDVLTPEYVTIPVPNQEVLDQIQNTTVIGGLFNTSNSLGASARITQVADVTAPNHGAIIFTPKALAAIPPNLENVFEADRLITVENAEANPATTMVATRLTVMGEKNHETTTTLDIKCVGTDMIMSGSVYQYQDDGRGNIVLKTVPLNNIFTQLPPNATPAQWLSWLKYTALVNPFDRHPAFYLFGPSESDPDQTYLWYLEQGVDNYTFISYDVLRRMHETALLSEFAVPVMGRFADKFK